MSIRICIVLTYAEKMSNYKRQWVRSSITVCGNSSKRHTTMLPNDHSIIRHRRPLHWHDWAFQQPESSTDSLEWLGTCIGLEMTNNKIQFGCKSQSISFILSISNYRSWSYWLVQYCQDTLAAKSFTRGVFRKDRIILIVTCNFQSLRNRDLVICSLLITIFIPWERA